jgi:hypothetical protein
VTGVQTCALPIWQINFFIFKNVYIFCVYAFDCHRWLRWSWVGVFAVSWFTVWVFYSVDVSVAYGVEGVVALAVAACLFVCWFCGWLVLCFDCCCFCVVFTADGA